MTGGSAEIAVRRLPHGEGLPLPGYATAGAAAMDLLAAVDSPLQWVFDKTASAGLAPNK